MATWNLEQLKHHVLICNGSTCMRHGAEEVTQSIRNEISQRKLDNIIHTTRTRCNGRCQDKCVVIQYPEGKWYKKFQPDDAALFIETLSNDYSYDQNVSHYLEDSNFKRTKQTVTGVIKK